MPLEDKSVSTATRPFGSCASISSSMLSLIKSAILSGCPALTDSLVNNFIISPSFRFNSRKYLRHARKARPVCVTAQSHYLVLAFPFDSPSEQQRDKGRRSCTSDGS